MANIKSAKKRILVTNKKKLNNNNNIASMKTAVKKCEKACLSNDKELASKELVNAVKKIDKALSNGIIKKNNAARSKSRLAKLVNEVK